jgi:hypothetical protein
MVNTLITISATSPDQAHHTSAMLAAGSVTAASAAAEALSKCPPGAPEVKLPMPAAAGHLSCCTRGWPPAGEARVVEPPHMGVGVDDWPAASHDQCPLLLLVVALLLVVVVVVVVVCPTISQQPPHKGACIKTAHGKLRRPLPSVAAAAPLSRPRAAVPNWVCNPSGVTSAGGCSWWRTKPVTMRPRAGAAHTTMTAEAYLKPPTPYRMPSSTKARALRGWVMATRGIRRVARERTWQQQWDVHGVGVGGTHQAQVLLLNRTRRLAWYLHIAWRLL